MAQCDNPKCDEARQTKVEFSYGGVTTGVARLCRVCAQKQLELSQKKPRFGDAEVVG